MKGGDKRDHRRKKRYLLLQSNRPLDLETTKGFMRLIMERYPNMPRKRIVWMESGLIVRTDNERLAEMKESLTLKVGETELHTRSVSGSIGKLKRLSRE